MEPSSENEPPVASPEVIEAIEDGPVITGQLQASDPEGDPLTFSPILTAQFAPGVSGLIVNADGSYSFDPSDPAYQSLAEGEVGEFLSGYFVSDGNHTDDATITITVTGVNDAPTFEPSVPEFLALAGMATDFSVNATDIDGDSLTFSAEDPDHGTVSGGLDGSFTYTPDIGFIGVDTITVTVSDGKGGMASLGLVVTVALPQTAGWNLFTTEGFAGAIGGYGTVFAAAGTQVIEVLDRPGVIEFSAGFNAGDDAIVLPGDASAWSVLRSGSDGVFSDGDTFAIVPAGAAGMPIAFDDGTYLFGVDSGEIVIGGQVLTNEPMAIMSPPDGTPLPTATDPGAIANLIMFPGGAATAGGHFSVFGTNAFETFALLAGDATFDSSWNRGGDKLVFGGPANAFTAMLAGSDVIVEGPATRVDLPVGPNGMTLDFAGDLRMLIYDTGLGQLTIGADVIGATSTPLS